MNAIRRRSRLWLILGTVAAIGFGGLLVVAGYDLTKMLLACRASQLAIKQEFGSPVSVGCSKNWGARFGWGSSEALVVSVRVAPKAGADPGRVKARVEVLVSAQFKEPVDRIDVVVGAAP